jgi:hypothetical protein
LQKIANVCAFFFFVCKKKCGRGKYEENFKAQKEGNSAKKVFIVKESSKSAY